MLLLSTLRLVFAFVEDSEQSTRMFAQANDSKSVKSLLKILKGPGIGNLKYETRLYYYIIMILHRFILHYSQSKNTIIQSSSLRIIVEMLAPQNLFEIPSELENTIYLFLMLLIKDDMSKKEVVGNIIFESVFQERLRYIALGNDFNINAAMKLYIDQQNDQKDLESHNLEYNFFALMESLTQNCTHNAKFARNLVFLLDKYIEVENLEYEARKQDREKVVSLINSIKKEALIEQSN